MEEMKNLKIYEEFSEVKELRQIIKNCEQKIIYLQSPEHIENSIRVKKLEEEKKEIENKH